VATGKIGTEIAHNSLGESEKARNDMKARIWIGLLGASLLLIVPPAFAQARFSDCFTILDSSGAFAVGTPVCVAEGLEGDFEGGILQAAPPGFANTGLFGSPTLVYEPDGTTLSDIFGIFFSATGACANGCIGFASNPSDIDVALFFPPPDDDDFVTLGLLEGANGGTFNATAYLDVTHQRNGFTATFFSDGDAAAAVPEPATLALLGLGALAMGFARRRNLRTTARSVANPRA